MECEGWSYRGSCGRTCVILRYEVEQHNNYDNSLQVPIDYTISCRGRQQQECHELGTDLFHDVFNVLQRDAAVVGSDDELEQVAAKYLKHHAHVYTVHSRHLEVVE